MKSKIDVNRLCFAFSGAGVRGVAYAGAIAALEELNLRPKFVAGSSAGSIAATLLAIGMDASTVSIELEKLDIRKFADDSYLQGVINLTQGGLHSGNNIILWVQDLFKRNGFNENLTFAELKDLQAGNSKFKDLFITACDLDDQEVKIFSYIASPHLRICDAIRMSASIPGFFVPFKNPLDNHYYVDGGTELNHPSKIFDNDFFISDKRAIGYVPNPNVIGFALTGPCFDKLRKASIIATRTFRPINFDSPPSIKTNLDIIESTLSIVVNNAQQDDLLDEAERYVLIPDHGISMIAFNITSAQKFRLIEEGKARTLEFCNNLLNNDISTSTEDALSNNKVIKFKPIRKFTDRVEKSKGWCTLL